MELPGEGVVMLGGGRCGSGEPHVTVVRCQSARPVMITTRTRRCRSPPRRPPLTASRPPGSNLKQTERPETPELTFAGRSPSASRLAPLIGLFGRMVSFSSS